MQAYRQSPPYYSERSQRQAPHTLQIWFAEEEEGYMFIEEGFRIRYNKGEVIDFYADTGADKKVWMKVPDAFIGKEGEGMKSGWRDLILKMEEALRRRTVDQQEMRKLSSWRHPRIKSMIV